MGVAVIINPASGRRGRRADDVEARVALAGAVVPGAQVEVTRAAGHGAELARRHVAAAADLVVAWGGDGTVNEVAGPLIGTQTALGIVPSGSGDGLARALGLPRDARHALECAGAGGRRAIDTGRLGDRHFLNIAGIGFDAAVAAAFNRSARRGLGTYVAGALRSVWSYESGAYDLTVDGSEWSGRCFVIAFANGSQYGNGLMIAPDADPFDGRLNLVLVEDGSPLRQIWRARRLAVDALRPTEGVRREYVREASVTGQRLVCHVDGETFEASGRLDVEVRPSSLIVAGTSELA